MRDTSVGRLLQRKAFGLNGATWVMLNEPDSDCQEAAHEIIRLRAAIEAEALWFEQECVGMNGDGVAKRLRAIVTI